MSDRVQPGVKIDRDVWEEFRKTVKDRKGGIRGHLKHEVENALREYARSSTSPTYEQVNRRLQRIEAAVGAAPTDGGTDTFEETEHTHTPEPKVNLSEKPAANAATDKKVAYLAESIREDHAGEFHEIPRKAIVETVKDAYAFRSDTAKRYVESLVDHFELRTHPTNDKLLVTQERHDEVIDQRREELRKEVEQDEP